MLFNIFITKVSPNCTIKDSCEYEHQCQSGAWVQENAHIAQGPGDNKSKPKHILSICVSN